MGARGRSKGKRGELEWAAVLRSHGVGARRGCQFAGGADSPDVVSDLEGFHFEVKRVEALRLYPSMKQAVGDAGELVPVVAHRKNREEWVVVMRAEDWIKLVKERKLR